MANKAQTCLDDRPKLHFSTPKGWMNDPNGLIYHDGYYHLYYQHYPDACEHGPMHWGHARSTNLMEWEDLPIALYPDENGTIFSGSVVYDKENTSGFGRDGTAPLVAIYTYHKEGEHGEYAQSQGIAYSLDGGMTFEKYEGNPVLTSSVPDFRDPKVFYHSESGQWIMPLAVERKIEFYTSPNLTDWAFASSFVTENPVPAGIWECPDLCRVKVKGTDAEQWVLIISVNAPDGSCFGMQYFVGSFDGTVFVSETPADEILLLDFGYDNYAAVTFAGVEDRTIILGWMNCWHYAPHIPHSTFLGSMTIPRELTLEKTTTGYVARQQPVAELYGFLNCGKHDQNASRIELPKTPCLLRIERTAGSCELELKNGNQSLRISVDDHSVRVDRRGCDGKDLGEQFHRVFEKACENTGCLSLLIDAASIELFADDGRAVGTFQVFPQGGFSVLQATAPLPEVWIFSKS